MAYVPVPKDLTKIKSKVMFSLTKRQILCFGGGALLGVPLFFLLRGRLGASSAATLMVIAMLPIFVLGLYERNGQPLEKALGNIIQTPFLRPKQRPYQADNVSFGYCPIRPCSLLSEQNSNDSTRQIQRYLFVTAIL